MSTKSFFPTPVWVTKIKDYVNINNDIYKYIKNMQSMDERGYKSNVNGWHSKNFNLADEQPRNSYQTFQRILTQF